MEKSIVQRERSVFCSEWKREGVIDSENGGDRQYGSDVCRVVRRWKNRMWMRLTERAREFISKAGCVFLRHIRQVRRFVDEPALRQSKYSWHHVWTTVMRCLLIAVSLSASDCTAAYSERCCTWHSLTASVLTSHTIPSESTLAADKPVVYIQTVHVDVWHCPWLSLHLHT